MTTAFAFTIAAWVLALSPLLLLMRGHRKKFLWVAPVAFIAAMLTVTPAPTPNETAAPAPVSLASTPQREPDPVASDENCMRFLRCWAERHTVNAARACKQSVEAQARINYRWTAAFASSILPAFRWKDQANGIVTYEGDEVELQNGLGVWVRHTYQCDYDAKAGQVVAVRVRMGRLPPTAH